MNMSESWDTGGQLSVSDSGSLTLKNMDIKTYGFFFLGIIKESVDNSKKTNLKIIDCNIQYNYLGIATQSFIQDTSSLKKINDIGNLEIINSKINNLDSYPDKTTAVILMFPMNVKIENSELSGDKQGLISYNGNITIKDSTIKLNKLIENDSFVNSDWGGANEAPSAAIVFGNGNPNLSVLYRNTSLTLINSNIVTPAGGKAIYIRGTTSEFSTIFEYDSTSKVNDKELTDSDIVTYKNGQYVTIKKN